MASATRPDDGTAVAAVERTLLVALGLVPDDTEPAPQRESVRDRILDVATGLFIAKGITETTMRAVAEEAGLSRAWLYRQFGSRDEIVQAIIVREARRFAEGLVAADDPHRPVREAVTGTFVLVVTELRHNAMVQRFRVHEPHLVSAFIICDSGPFLKVMVDALAGYLDRRAALAPERAAIAAEAIIRLIVSTGLSATAVCNFDDTDQLRTFAEQVIPALLA
ncbi:TetR/AcrR family transcriptional regulator [Actinomadura napierensis]|uniref:TetR/AcrR family transcriptional regulator n=1 Tax=Actinomadura napierensis TaxID=267854 RepID=UPI0031D01A50